MEGIAPIKNIKTFNDPVYGFISITDPLVFEIIEHPSFQRLRRITQLGLTNLVYTGANHTRFQHAIGAMHLMSLAINVLRSKGIDITEDEARASKVAILLHDVGHGPYSHALEHSIVAGVTHEQISIKIMQAINLEMNGALDLAIRITRGEYHKQFLHQLVSSQLDTDRLDYLKRDSFFTGVIEGAIGSERIIKMLSVVDGNLVVEAKGIYSLEKFLIARRLMYWQVYLHKTVLSAEFLLMNILSRARALSSEGKAVKAPSALAYFLSRNEPVAELDPEWLDYFLDLDDIDILYAIKGWQHADDKVLSMLCQRLVNRTLLKTRVSKVPFEEEYLNTKKAEVAQQWGLTLSEADYLVFERKVTNSAYNLHDELIRILYKDGTTMDLAEAADMFQFSSPSTIESKYFCYYPQIKPT